MSEPTLGLRSARITRNQDEAAVLSEPKIQENEAAERKMPKLVMKYLKAEGDPITTPPTEPIGFVSQPKPDRAEINRANSQLSTGPHSETGKLASSRNSLRHGLASGTLVIPGEDLSDFETLKAELIAEHQPATETEILLVIEMAQSWWLTQRAIHFQNECFTADGVDEKRLSLFLRYQTTHERTFHKALDTLLKLKRSRAREQAISETGFVSQNTSQQNRDRRKADAPTGFVSQYTSFDSPETPPTRAEAA
jgi:hypothetical protein